MLSYREQKVADHLKEHRPRMYAELVKSGRLEATAKRMWSEYTDQYADLIEKGLAPNQAEELSRELAFPPSESDQPHLGEQPQGPTTVETTG
jgi:hypothetical protein